MAQITSSTASVTPTSGEDWVNHPMNPQKVLQAYKTTATINGADLTLYPAIKFVLDYSFKVQENRNDLSDKNCVYWIYASGDTVTRDLDFADANDKIGEAGGGGGGGGADGQFVLTGQSKISTNYRFDALNKTVTVKDADFVAILVITNLRFDKVIYDATSTALGGTVDGNMVTLTFDTTGMDNTDPLLIAYDARDLREEDTLFRLIYDELQTHTKLLKKILRN